MLCLYFWTRSSMATPTICEIWISILYGRSCMIMNISPGLFVSGMLAPLSIWSRTPDAPKNCVEVALAVNLWYGLYHTRPEHSVRSHNTSTDYITTGTNSRRRTHYKLFSILFSTLAIHYREIPTCRLANYRKNITTQTNINSLSSLTNIEDNFSRRFYKAMQFSLGLGSPKEAAKSEPEIHKV